MIFATIFKFAQRRNLQFFSCNRLAINRLRGGNSKNDNKIFFFLQ